MLPAALVALMSLWRRREREQVHTPPAPPQSMYPPVIVVAPPTMNLPPASQSYMPPSSMPAPRQFTVIGDDAMDST
jgi:hypothetical protein